METDYLAQMRGSVDYKIGFLRGMIRTAAWLLQRNSPDLALQHLEWGAKEMNFTLDPFDMDAIEEDSVNDFAERKCNHA